MSDATRRPRRWLIRALGLIKSAAALVKEAYATGRTIREEAREKSGIPEQRLNQLLDPRSQVG